MRITTTIAVAWGFLIWPLAAAADTYVLVTPDEYERSLAAPEEEFIPRPTLDPLAPTIEMKRPGESSQYTAPVDIEIVFVPQDGASIDLNTLKITYGRLGIDVTRRVTENAEVTMDGILSLGANMPVGKHRLTVSIADSDGREGKRRFRFEIVKR